MTTAEIIDQHDLTFDPGDPLNGSLYVCLARGRELGAQRDEIISDLRAAGLWSQEAPKQVPDEHRAAYSEQLRFIEAVTYKADGYDLTIARFDHEKFPSDKGRWDDWKDEFDAQYARI